MNHAVLVLVLPVKSVTSNIAVIQIVKAGNVDQTVAAGHAEFALMTGFATKLKAGVAASENATRLGLLAATAIFYRHAAAADKAA